MKKIKHQMIGIDQDDLVLFSDFKDDGEMWTGHGQRERRKRVLFSEKYAEPPAVHVSISMWDIDSGSPARAELKAETITIDGFDIVFRTWADTRVARIRAAWTAIGPLRHSDDWDVL